MGWFFNFCFILLLIAPSSARLSAPSSMSSSSLMYLGFVFVCLADQKLICLSDFQSEIIQINRISSTENQLKNEERAEEEGAEEAGRLGNPIRNTIL